MFNSSVIISLDSTEGCGSFLWVGYRHVPPPQPGCVLVCKMIYFLLYIGTRMLRSHFSYSYALCRRDYSRLTVLAIHPVCVGFLDVSKFFFGCHCWCCHFLKPVQVEKFELPVTIHCFIIILKDSISLMSNNRPFV